MNINGIFFIAPVEQIDRLSGRDLHDCLRFEMAYPVDNAPEGFYMFRKFDGGFPEPAVSRWATFGVDLKAWGRNKAELLSKADELEQPEVMSDTKPVDTQELVGALSELVNAFDPVARTTKQQLALERAATVLNGLQALGVKVFNLPTQHGLVIHR